MQNTLKEQSQKLQDSKLLTMSSDVLSVTEEYEFTLPFVRKLSGKTVLLANRRAARLALAMAWAIDEITTFVPQKPEDLAEHAEHVRSKLIKKGFGGMDCLCSESQQFFESLPHADKPHNTSREYTSVTDVSSRWCCEVCRHVPDTQQFVDFHFLQDGIPLPTFLTKCLDRMCAKTIIKPAEAVVAPAAAS
jgi:hypothetical protein